MRQKFNCGDTVAEKLTGKTFRIEAVRICNDTADEQYEYLYWDNPAGDNTSYKESDLAMPPKYKAGDWVLHSDCGAGQIKTVKRWLEGTDFSGWYYEIEGIQGDAECHLTLIPTPFEIGARVTLKYTTEPVYAIQSRRYITNECPNWIRDTWVYAINTDGFERHHTQLELVTDEPDDEPDPSMPDYRTLWKQAEGECAGLTERLAKIKQMAENI